MSTTTKTIFHPTDTVTRYYYFKDITGALFNPDTTTALVYDETWTSIGEVTLVSISTGKYRFDYNIPSDANAGTWHIIIGGTKDTFSNKETFGFVVELTNPT